MGYSRLVAAESGEEDRPAPDRIRIAMGALIQDLRNEAGLSGADLAAVVGRSRVAVSNWEGGREMPGQDPVDAMKVRFAHKAVELQSLRDAYLEAKGKLRPPFQLPPRQRSLVALSRRSTTHRLPVKTSRR